jgi:RimJ/RimL family protein N-acetyltransferase
MSEKIVYGDPQDLLKVSMRLDRIPNPYGDVVITRRLDEDVAGGVIYSDFTRESVVVHVAGFKDGWLSRLFLFMAFDYPFNQMKVNRIFSQIAETNEISLGFNARLGFRPVTYIPGVYRNNKAMIVTKLEKADCRWLDLKRYYEREHADGR